MLWIYYIKRRYDSKRKKTHANAYKGIQIEIWLLSVPLSISVSFHPFRAVKILHLYSVDEKNEGWGIGASLCP